jgi:hypothetical protein|tara:strand:+ start:1233 stop:1400 length:168 start_codon:yes stop_codon:yes gene_type:complete
VIVLPARGYLGQNKNRSKDHNKKAINLLNGLTASKKKNYSHKIVTFSKEAKLEGM